MSEEPWKFFGYTDTGFILWKKIQNNVLIRKSKGWVYAKWKHKVLESNEKKCFKGKIKMLACQMLVLLHVMACKIVTCGLFN